MNYADKLILCCFDRYFQKDKESELAYRWRYCALKQERLREPIVMCGLGRLYSKQSIIEQLLDKDTEMPEACKHIKSLRDVRDLVLTPNPIFKDVNKTEGMLDTRGAPYICKLIGLEMSGKFRFIALWSCGCVFSERALKEIGTKVCSLCQTPFTDEDVIILNGTDEEAEAMATKFEARIARRKSDKKSKKESKKAVATALAATATVTSGALAAETIAVKAEPGVESDEMKPILDTKVFKTVRLIKQENEAGPSNTGKNLPKSSVKRSAKDTILDSTMKKFKEKNGTSVENDPKATEVYKSLFTSHDSARTQERAHWVTYNPFYN